MEIVGPLLIMLMVGALVFFLIEVFYRGPHALRLGWVLGLFTAASVLVSRISIAEGLERAAIFGFALAAATLFVTVSLVDFEYGGLFFLEPIVVGLLIAVVMWSSNRLTWDCTVIDSSRDVSSIGLAELVRRKLFKRSLQSKPSSESDEDVERGGLHRALFMFFANSKNKNTPGLWVFYFAIAAFPIFGFGQWFARASDDWGYRWIFLLFAIYLGAALGLLMLTSLMGLERYLRKRGATMPASVSRAWMVVGTVFALGVMLLMLLLPSPSLSNGLQDALGFLTTNSKSTSKNAIGKDGQDEGENPKGEKQDENAEGGKEKAGEKGAGNGDTGKGGDGKSDKKGNDSGGKEKSDGKSDSKKSDSKNSKSEKSKQGEKSDSKKSDSNDGEKDSKDQRNDDDKNEKRDSDQKGEQGEDQENENDKEKAKGNQAKDKQENQNAKKQANNRGQKQNAQPKHSQTSSPSGLAKFIGTVMKYIFYIGGFIALLVMAWMFREELAKLWRDLFGQKKERAKAAKPTAEPVAEAKPKMHFSQFSNPFENGFHEKWPAAVTLQYTFEAVEAWGRGHQIERQSDQTPHEFATDLRQVDKAVASEARKLADLLGESLYSGGEVERSSILILKSMWQRMLANAPRQTQNQLQPA
jgi:hypothetical protein